MRKINLNLTLDKDGNVVIPLNEMIKYLQYMKLSLEDTVDEGWQDLNKMDSVDDANKDLIKELNINLKNEYKTAGLNALQSIIDNLLITLLKRILNFNFTFNKKLPIL